MAVWKTLSAACADIRPGALMYKHTVGHSDIAPF